MDPTTRTFFVAGVKFRPTEEISLAATKINEAKGDPSAIPVKLVGEPSNKFDRYAVKVFLADVFIGYIPKPINVDIWALKDGGLKPSAELVQYNFNAPTHEMFKVQVSFTKP